MREIPVERIIGSVDRSADFGRDFRPRRRLSGSRLASLRTAFPDGVMPAITVFEVGGAYFVEDGHHRVALARERGADHIDAEVTGLETSSQVSPDVDVAELIDSIRIFSPLKLWLSGLWLDAGALTTTSAAVVTSAASNSRLAARPSRIDVTSTARFL